MKAALLALLLSLVAMAGCSDDNISSDTEARWAYLGFDSAIDKALNLGFDGFNAATSANIPDQNGLGDVDGTMVVGGQVDQGNSANKEMRLVVTLVDYYDGPVRDDVEDIDDLDVTYTTPELMPLELDLSLRSIPNGTFTGTLVGTALLTGDLEAEGTFMLSLAGEIQEDPADASRVIRTPGTLTITGTVTSSDGVFDVDVMR